MARHRSDLKQREQIYRACLQNACDAWPEFDIADDEVSGADMVHWFSAWRAQTLETLRVLKRRGEA